MTVRLDDQDIEKNGKYPRDNDDGQILSPWLREREKRGGIERDKVGKRERKKTRREFETEIERRRKRWKAKKMKWI
jgi:hypothetical protein